VRSIVVSANDEDAARDMAVKERPMAKAGGKQLGKPSLDEAPARRPLGRPRSDNVHSDCRRRLPRLGGRVVRAREEHA